MLPGYVVSTMVRALRELTGVSRKPVDEAKAAINELSNAELEQALVTYEHLLRVAEECRNMRLALIAGADEMVRQAGVESTKEAARRLGVIS
jgi:hypothetical protein